MQCWFAHQSFILEFMFENARLLQDSWDKVLEGWHYICQQLEEPILWIFILIVIDGFGPTLHHYPF